MNSRLIYGPRFVWFAVKQAIRTRTQKFGKVGTFYGVTVFRSAPKMRYGFSNWMLNPTNRTHYAESIYICWFDGKIIASAVRWRCGIFTPHFQLVNGPESPACRACLKNFLLNN